MWSWGSIWIIALIMNSWVDLKTHWYVHCQSVTYSVFNYRDQGETIKINWNEPWLCKKCLNTQSQCCFVSSRQERGGSCCLGFHFHKHPTTHPLSLSSSLFVLQLNALNFLVHWIVDSTVCVDAKIMTAACFSCYRKRGKCLLEMRDCLDFPVWALGGGWVVAGGGVKSNKLVRSELRGRNLKGACNESKR